MLTLEPLLSHLVPFTLVVFRMAGLFVFTPVLANRSMPAKFRAMLALLFGAALYPIVPSTAQVAPDVSLAGLLPLVLSETLIGVVIGFLAGLPILALDMSGFLMGHQMGMSLGRVYNPDVGSDTDSFGQILMYLGLATFLSVGGLEVCYLTLASTFKNVPVGSFAAGRVPLEAVVGAVASGVELAIRVAAPVLAIIFLLMIALGFVMKTMPQINVMSVGFTVKILFGIAMLAVSLVAMQRATGEEIERVLRVVVEWGRSLA
jgi:flagellar biosynthetic protein FliR